LVLESKQVETQGQPAQLVAERLLVLNSGAVVVQGFDVAITAEILFPLLAAEVRIQGFNAAFITERNLLAEPKEVIVQGFPAIFVGSYIYPEPAFVKAGVTYGPSGSDFIGEFRFNPSFDIMTGNFVTQSSYEILPFGLESNITTLTANLVAEGVLFGTDSLGTAKGFISYDVNTGRIANPVADKVLVVV